MLSARLLKSSSKVAKSKILSLKQLTLKDIIVNQYLQAQLLFILDQINVAAFALPHSKILGFLHCQKLRRRQHLKSYLMKVRRCTTIHIKFDFSIGSCICTVLPLCAILLQSVIISKRHMSFIDAGLTYASYLPTHASNSHISWTARSLVENYP